MASKPWIRWLALVTGVALALRLAHLAAISGTPLASVLLGDAQQYDAWARRLAAGDWLGTGVFYQAPLYPYLLGVIYAVVGHSLLAVRVFQAVLGTLSCVLLAVAGRRFFGARAGLVAGALLAVYPPAIFFDGLLQKSSLDLFLMVLLLALLGEFMAGGPALRLGRLAPSLRAPRATSRGEDHALQHGPGNPVRRPSPSGAAAAAPFGGSEDHALQQGPADPVCRPSPSGAARRPWPWLAGAGLALGAFMLTRENARVIYPVVLAWVWFYFRAVPARTRAAWLAVFTLAVAAPSIPVGVRNAYVGGEFLMSTSQAGTNFYIGNHAGALGSYEALAPGHDFRFEREDATRIAETARGRRLSSSEVSDYWLGLAVRDIRQAPGRWLALVGRKLLLTFNAAEVVDTESVEVYREHSPVLAIPISFGVILVLAAVGAWLTRRDWRRLSLLYGVAASFALSVALFYVVSRYRYPLAPVVLLFAGAAVAGAPAAVKARREWLPALALAGAAVVVAWLPIVPTADETNLNIGNALVGLDRPSEAVPWLERAAAAAPGYAAPRFALGVAFERMGERQKSLDEFAVAARLSPNDFETQAALGLARQDLGDTAGAVAAFREAVRLRPDDAKAQFNLASALQRAGDGAGAIPHYEAALRVKPDYAEAHSNLALAMQGAGNLAGAIDHLREAAKLQPTSAAIWFNLAGMLDDAGRGGEALGAYEQAARLSPGSADVQFSLAQAYARAGRWQDALGALGKARGLAAAAGRQEAVAAIDAAIEMCRKKIVG